MIADIVNALWFLLSSIVNFVTHIPTYVSVISGTITHLPDFLVLYALAMIPVLIVNKLMHAGGGD